MGIIGNISKLAAKAGDEAVDIGKVTAQEQALRELAMDYASRMERAKGMGFDPEKIMYHGTTDPSFDEFDFSKADPGALFGPGVYTTSNPDVAGGKIVKRHLEKQFESPEDAKAAGNPELALEIPEKRRRSWHKGKWESLEEKNPELEDYIEGGYAGLQKNPDSFKFEFKNDEAKEKFIDRILEENSALLRHNEIGKENADKVKDILYKVSNPPFIPMERALFDIRNVAGDRFYFPNLAQGLGKVELKGKGGVYPLLVKAQNPFEIEAKATEVFSELQKRIKEFLRQGNDLPDKGNPEWAFDLAKRLSRNTLRHLEYGNGNDIYDFIQEMMPWKETSAETKQMANKFLRLLGYDSIKHRGGKRVGGMGEHDVTILLNPRNVRSKFAKFDPKKAASKKLMDSYLLPAAGASAAIEGE